MLPTRTTSTLRPHPYQDNFAETLGKDSYGGDYIIDEAAEFWRTDGDKWVDADPQERMESFRERGYVKMVDNMRDLCHAVNCDFDVGSPSARCM